MGDNGNLDAVFSALADPTRRAVVTQLLSGPSRAGDLAEAVSMSAPALSRHLRVLRLAGLIIEDRVVDDARVRQYRLQPAAFAPVRDWVTQVEAMWVEQLDSFKDRVEALARKGKGGS